MAIQVRCTGRERAKLIENTSFNGIDYLEVIEPENAGDIPLLIVFCFRPQTGEPIEKTRLEFALSLFR